MFKIINHKSAVWEYGFASLAILFTGLVCFPLTPAIGYQTVGLLFLMVVAGLSLFLGRGPVLYAAILNFTIWNYFFIPPLFNFHVYNLHDAITLFANFLIAIVGGTLIHRIRENQANLKKSQEDTSILYSLLEALNNTISIKDVVMKARQELKKHFEADVVIFLIEKEGSGLAKKPFGNGDLFRDEDFHLALETFNSGQIQGRYTESSGESKLQFHPLIVPRGTIGVAGVHFDNALALAEDKFNLLRSFLTQIALSLEREINIDLVKQNMIHYESEKLFQTILNSVSHELRTPIAIISAAVANLDNENSSDNPVIRRQICEELNIASLRLNLLVENILDMSRIESGLLKLKLEYCDISDLFGIVLNEVKSGSQYHRITTSFDENIPLFKADINLLKQSIINIIHNSLVYTPEGTNIVLNARLENTNKLIIEISDNGPGVPEENLKFIFNKFYRIPGSKSGGTGLGLAISKAIIEAHGGRISAKTQSSVGLSISIKLAI